jgi:SAM-dependent methyltransferase
MRTMARVVQPVLLYAARALERVRNGLVYAAAGTMTLRDIREAIALSWGNFNAEDDDVHSGLMRWEKVLVDRFIRRFDRVLLVGCGTGRDLIPLVEMGCRVTGVEPSSRAAAGARRLVDERRMDVPIIDGYFEDVVLPGAFDVVVFSYFCLSYIPGSVRRIDVLRKARAHLTPGGRIIVSFLFRQKPPRGRVISIGRLAGWLAGSDWRLEPGDALERGGIAPPAINYEHIFGPGEIEGEAASAGLAVAGRGGHPHHEPFIVFVPA